LASGKPDHRWRVSVDGLTACNRDSSGGDVMASVNGRKIYRSEVDKYYANQTAGSDQQPSRRAGGEPAVEHFERADRDRDPDAAGGEAWAAGDRRRSRPQTERDQVSLYGGGIQQAHADKKITLDDFKRDLRRSLTRDKVLNKEITSRINITDQDVSELLQRSQSGIQPD
jgi:peptidyl-prolyl cis-trans isomerase SurA